MVMNPQQMELAMEIDEEYAKELQREENVIESLLFTLGRSVSVEEMAAALDCGRAPAEKAAERLLKKYEERKGGIRIQKLEDRYQMCTSPDTYEALIRVAKHPKKPVLTSVVMETLAIIAYRQPVTKAEIEQIRGVKSDHAVNKLIEYELVEESGRLEAPGRPALFVTTENFLRRFGLSSLEDLPALGVEDKAEIESEAESEADSMLGTRVPEDKKEELQSNSSDETGEPGHGENAYEAAEPVPKETTESEHEEGSSEVGDHISDETAESEHFDAEARLPEEAEAAEEESSNDGKDDTD